MTKNAIQIDPKRLSARFEGISETMYWKMKQDSQNEFEMDQRTGFHNLVYFTHRDVESRQCDVEIKAMHVEVLFESWLRGKNSAFLICKNSYLQFERFL